MEQITFRRADQPAVRVEVDDQWCPGRLVMWTRGPMGWFGIVRWEAPHRGQERVNVFPHHQIQVLDDHGKLTAEQAAQGSSYDGRPRLV